MARLNGPKVGEEILVIDGTIQRASWFPEFPAVLILAIQVATAEVISVVMNRIYKKPQQG